MLSLKSIKHQTYYIVFNAFFVGGILFATMALFSIKQKQNSAYIAQEAIVEEIMQDISNIPSHCKIIQTKVIENNSKLLVKYSCSQL